jgi:hypothetical protein
MEAGGHTGKNGFLAEECSPEGSSGCRLISGGHTELIYRLAENAVTILLMEGMTER